MTRLAIKRPIGLLMCVLLILVFGFVSLTSMPVDLISDINMPIAVVYSAYPGASPKEVESLVTTVLEKSLSTVPGLRTLASTSAENIAIVTLEFSYDVNLDDTMQTVREKLDGVKSSLPDGAEFPVAMQVNVNETPVCTIAVTGEQAESLLAEVRESVAPDFEKINGVASVDVVGGREREIRVELKPEALSTYGLTQETVAQLIGGSYVNFPIGTLEYGSKNLLVRGEHKFKSAEELAKIPLVTPKGAVVQLSDVATVAEITADANSLARVDSNECVLLAINKQQDGNTLAIAKDVEKVVSTFSESADFSLVVVNNQGDLIDDSVSNVAGTLLLGGLLAVFVLWLILGDLKLSLVVATSIPLSVIATFVLMYFSDMTLNIISLGGLVMGVGMMVDNSIVVLESIFAAKDEGRSYTEAAIYGTKQVASAVTASTLTTVAVFLPIIFITGLAKEIFTQAALTVTYSMLTSLLSALTLIPCLFVLLKPKTNGGKISTWLFDRLANGYGVVIDKVTRVKWLVVAVGFAVLVASFQLIPHIGTALLAPMDQGKITVVVQTETGTDLSVVDGATAKVEAILASKPDIANYFASIGGGNAYTLGNENKSTIDVILKKDRSQSTYDLVAELRADVADLVNCQVTVTPVDSMVTSIMGGGGSMDSGLSVDISAPDEVGLKHAVAMIVDMARGVPGVMQVNTSNQVGSPEARVEINAIKAASYGLAPASVLASARHALTGLEVTQMTKGDVDLPVVLSYPKSMFTSLSDLEALPILTPMGSYIPLREIASVVEDTGAVAISRSNNRRIMNVSAQVDSALQSDAMKEFRSQMKLLDLPAGIQISYGGQEMLKNESFSGLTQALLLSLVLVFMIMAIQFESARFSFVVLISVPLAFIGAALGLLVSGDTLNIASFIGIIMLVGIVVNNAIVLIDRAGQEKNALAEEARFRKGDELTKDEHKHLGKMAIMAAGKGRLRPIAMTTITTVLGLLPLALGLSSGTEIMRPMAVVVIGGLLSSTLLTLLLIPCMYLIVYKK